MVEPIHVAVVKEACAASAPVCWMDGHEGTGVWAGAIATSAAVIVAIFGPWLDRWLRQRSEDQARFEVSSTRENGTQGIQLQFGYTPRDFHSGINCQVTVIEPKNGVALPGHLDRNRGGYNISLGGNPGRTATVGLVRSSDSDVRRMKGAILVARAGSALGPQRARVRIKILDAANGSLLYERKLKISPLGEDPSETRLIG